MGCVAFEHVLWLIRLVVTYCGVSWVLSGLAIHLEGSYVGAIVAQSEHVLDNQEACVIGFVLHHEP